MARRVENEWRTSGERELKELDLSFQTAEGLRIEPLRKPICKSKQSEVPAE